MLTYTLLILLKPFRMRNPKIVCADSVLDEVPRATSPPPSGILIVQESVSKDLIHAKI